MVYGMALALLVITWSFPPAGIVLQGAWLIWVLFENRRQTVLIWLTFPLFILVHLIAEIRIYGPEGIIAIVDLPYSVLAVAVAIRARSKVPWWQSLILTPPMTSVAVLLLIDSFGVGWPSYPWIRH